MIATSIAVVYYLPLVSDPRLLSYVVRQQNTEASSHQVGHHVPVILGVLGH